jgi:flavodoxin
MKVLVVYYSRTGNTEKIAKILAAKTRADIERIYDLKNRGGIWGWIMGGKEGMEKRMTKIGSVKMNPVNYDLVIVGTPIWVNCPPATRTYLSNFSNKFKKVAFFCTMGGSGFEKLFLEMENLAGVKPVKTMAVTDKQIQENSYSTLIDGFVAEILK